MTGGVVETQGRAIREANAVSWNIENLDNYLDRLLIIIFGDEILKLSVLTGSWLNAHVDQKLLPPHILKLKKNPFPFTY